MSKEMNTDPELNELLAEDLLVKYDDKQKSISEIKIIRSTFFTTVAINPKVMSNEPYHQEIEVSNRRTVRFRIPWEILYFYQGGFFKI